MAKFCCAEEMKNSDININVVPQGGGDKTPWYIRTVKWYVDSVVNASIVKIFKVFFVTFFFVAAGLVAVYAYNIVNNKETVESKKTGNSLTEEEKEKIRDIVTPKIQYDLEALLYQINADRVFIFEMHNGQNNLSGLPFPFANMSYEEVNISRRIDKVYHKYKDVPLTQYKYPEYLRQNKFMMGTIEEVEKIDYDYAKRASEDGCKYMVVQYLNVSGKPLAFLGASYHNLSYVPSDSLIRDRFTGFSSAITELLDLKKQAEKMEKGE